MRNCILLIDSIRSVENTGSIFRTAEGLGVRNIILAGTTPTPLDRFKRKRKDFAKVSLGAEEMIEWKYVKNSVEAVEGLKKDGFEIISLEQSDTSVNLKEFYPKDDFVLVVGNEVEGVSKEILDISDIHVEIPMQGKKESLNVSVATGIALSVLI